MDFVGILLIVLFVVAAILGLLYWYNRKNAGKLLQAQEMIEANKATASIFVIDKKRERPTKDNLPSLIYSQLPKSGKLRKLCIIKAKVGPKVATLLCDKNVFDALVCKKTVKVHLSGLYIMDIVGMNLENKKKKSWKEKLLLFSKKGISQK